MQKIGARILPRRASNRRVGHLSCNSPSSPLLPLRGALDLLLRGFGLAVKSGSVAKSRTRFIFHVPFTGNPQLFHCRPRMTPPHPLHATVGDVELAFPYVGPRHDGNLIRMDFDRDLSSLKTSLAWIAQDVEEFNASLLEPVSKRIRARQEELPHHREIAKKLGVPTIRATDLVGTREPPTAEPDVASQPPPDSTDPKTPLPPFDIRDFGHSLNYRRVWVHDLVFNLGPMPAHAIAILYDRFVEGEPDMKEECLIKRVGSSQGSFYDLIRKSGAWNKLVRGGRYPGTVRLNLSSPPKTR